MVERRRPVRSDQPRLTHDHSTVPVRYATPVNVPLLTIAVFSMWVTAYVGVLFLAVDPLFTTTGLWLVCVGGFALSIGYVVISTSRRILHAFTRPFW